ncbi:hypothetical protein RE091_000149 [Klebsiella variicola]|nr:hypothetical protein [Klebsiella variicola]
MKSNLSNWTDEQLKNYHKSLIEAQFKSLSDKGTAVGLLLFYGLFAFGGGMMWAIDEVLSRLELISQIVFLFLTISGAISLVVSIKKDRESISRKASIREELEMVQEEIFRRKLKYK